MKIYISVDMEGIAGVSHRNEVDPEHKEYSVKRELMTLEAVAACEGALKAGATEIVVRDAHWDARNIDPAKLPKEARLIRGWSRHPYMMVQELDRTFAACAMVGYHSRAGSGGNPMAHTMLGRMFAEMRLNGTPMSEYMLHTMAAGLEDVPVVFLSGDEELCREATRFNEGLATVSTSTGRGASMVCLNPSVSRESIRAGVEKAVGQAKNVQVKKAPAGELKFEVCFKAASDAHANSFYPGAKQTSDHVVELRTDSYFECLRMLTFMR